MTRNDLAALLNGREYRREITKAEEAQAKSAGLLVVFGASDDLMEFRGAFHDEIGAGDGTIALVTGAGVLPSWENLEFRDEQEVQRYFELKPQARTVTARWDADGYSWIIASEVPHADFDIVEDGEKYCRGIVLSVADLNAPAPEATLPAGVRAALQATRPVLARLKHRDGDAEATRALDLVNAACGEQGAAPAREVMSDAWLEAAFDRALFLGNCAPHEPAANVLRGFANRVLQQFGDREGMRDALNVAYTREMAKRESGS